MATDRTGLRVAGACFIFLIGLLLFLVSGILAIGIHQSLEWYLSVPTAWISFALLVVSYRVAQPTIWEPGAKKAVQVVLAFAALNLVTFLPHLLMILRWGATDDTLDDPNFLVFQGVTGTTGLLVSIWFYRKTMDDGRLPSSMLTSR